MSESWMKVLSTAQVAGPTLATFTTAVSALPPQAKYTLAPDSWWIGKRLQVVVDGQVSNVVTAGPTFTFDVKFGATSVFTTGAIQCSTTAHTAVPFHLEIYLTCRSVGDTTSATLMGQGIITSRAFIDATGADVTTIGHPTLMVPETSPAVGTGFSSNASQQVDLFAACSTSNAANAITVQQYALLAGE